MGMGGNGNSPHTNPMGMGISKKMGMGMGGNGNWIDRIGRDGNVENHSHTSLEGSVFILSCCIYTLCSNRTRTYCNHSVFMSLLWTRLIHANKHIAAYEKNCLIMTYFAVGNYLPSRIRNILVFRNRRSGPASPSIEDRITDSSKCTVAVKF